MEHSLTIRTFIVTIMTNRRDFVQKAMSNGVFFFNSIRLLFVFSCPFLHRNANDTERRYHLRYFKTGICTHETDVKGHCLKNGLHCSSGHGANDLRQPVLDSRELQNSDLALERLARLCLSLESERALNDDPKWTGEIDKNDDEKRNDVTVFLRFALRSRTLQN